MKRNPQLRTSMVVVAIQTGVLFLTASGCASELSKSEQAKIATAYAEVLIAANLTPLDSVASRRAQDSAARANGYSDRAEVFAKVKSAGANSESLSFVLDSAKKRLESAQHPPATSTKKP